MESTEPQFVTDDLSSEELWKSADEQKTKLFDLMEQVRLRLLSFGRRSLNNGFACGNAPGFAATATKP